MKSKSIVIIHTAINQAGQYRNRITVDGVASVGEWADAIYAKAEADELAHIWRHENVTRTADAPAQTWLEFDSFLQQAIR